MKQHNFSAGPAILPQEVFAEASKAVLDYGGGLSILEMSHRSPEMSSMLDSAHSIVKELLQLSDDYAVLFLTGGASTQFFVAAANLLNQDQTAGYVNTGDWSTKAIKEAKLYGHVNVLASSSDKNFNYIPKGYDIPDDLAYLHITSNNTIFGTQTKNYPKTNVPIVCDMSSDIFSRPIEIEKFGLIYAGSQKNMGPAGTTLVIVRKDLLGKVNRTLPTMIKYETHIAKESAFNTPPIFPIYVSLLTMKWVQKNGGLVGMQKRNEEKAAVIYNEIERNSLFSATAATEDRSLMNVTFVSKDAALDKPFLELCTSHGISGIEGHRSVGGFRASIYNAMEISSVQLLADLMREFEEKNA